MRDGSLQLRVVSKDSMVSKDSSSIYTMVSKDSSSIYLLPRLATVARELRELSLSLDLLSDDDLGAKFAAVSPTLPSRIRLSSCAFPLPLHARLKVMMCFDLKGG